MIDKEKTQKQNTEANGPSLPRSVGDQTEDARDPKPNTKNPSNKLRIRERFARWREKRRARWQDAQFQAMVTVRHSRVIAFSTFLYMVFAGWTLWEIHSGSKDTHMLADTTAKQLEALKDIQSARLVVEKFDAKLIPENHGERREVRARVNFTIRNGGPTVANEIFIMKNSGSFDLTAVPIKYPPWEWTPPLPLPNGRSLTPGQTMTYEPELPASERKGIFEGSRIIYFTIGISYRDIFGRAHITTECDWYGPSVEPHWKPCFWRPTPKNPGEKQP